MQRVGWRKKSTNGTDTAPHTEDPQLLPASPQSLVILTVESRRCIRLKKKVRQPFVEGRNAWRAAYSRLTPYEPLCCPSGSVRLVYAVRQPLHKSAQSAQRFAVQPFAFSLLTHIATHFFSFLVSFCAPVTFSSIVEGDDRMNRLETAGSSIKVIRSRIRIHRMVHGCTI